MTHRRMQIREMAALVASILTKSLEISLTYIFLEIQLIIMISRKMRQLFEGRKLADDAVLV